MKTSSAEIKKLLQTAAKLSTEQGHRWTEMRENVFAAILLKHKPLTAYQLIEHLSLKQNKDIKPASVYRSLDALCELGLVIKIESLNAFTACTHPDHHHQHVFLVCHQCGMADEVDDCTISNQLNTDAVKHGFKVERQVLELQGTCRNCHT